MSHGELNIGMLVHFLIGQLSTTQQIVDTQAVTASCAWQGSQIQISGNRRKDSTGLGAFSSSFPPPHREWSRVLGFKLCALS